MEKSLVQNVIETSINSKESEKVICNKLGINYKCLYYYKKKYGFVNCSRGKHANSKMQRKHKVNDDFFESLNLSNCYWAGFIAADGYISKNSKFLTLALASKDTNHLQKFIEDLDSNYNILQYKARGVYATSYITITSDKICSDLYLNFNIPTKKSLTLLPPNINVMELISAFIIGYIDGDGSISLINSKSKCSPYLSISLLGTLQVCTWIKDNISKICNKKIGNIYPHKSSSKKTFSYNISNRAARVVFEKLYNLNVPKLSRKWREEYFKYCLNFSKKRNLNKYNEILNLKLKGLSQTDIAKMRGVTQASISWYYKQEMFKNLERSQ